MQGILSFPLQTIFDVSDCACHPVTGSYESLSRVAASWASCRGLSLATGYNLSCALCRIVPTTPQELHLGREASPAMIAASGKKGCKNVSVFAKEKLEANVKLPRMAMGVDRHEGGRIWTVIDLARRDSKQCAQPPQRRLFKASLSDIPPPLPTHSSSSLSASSRSPT